MAARSRPRGAVHRFRLALRREGHPPQPLEVRTARHPSESPVHLAARVLALALEARADLELRFRAGGVSAGDGPALEARAPDGSPVLAVEIGAPDARRLSRLLRRFGEVAVYCHRDARPLRRALARVGARPGRLRVHELPRELVEGLAEGLRADNRWEVELEGDSVAVTAAPAGGTAEPRRLRGRIAAIEAGPGS